MHLGSRLVRRGLLSLGLVAALVLAGCGGSPADADNTVAYTLDNGLKVILHKDDRLPIAAVNVSYHVGPANEAAGRTGFAHLFEHMMFTSSGHIPDGKSKKVLAAVGATNVNAQTNFDNTQFQETVPANALETALWMESDRMGFLLDALGQTKLANQQRVVRNERRQSYEAAGSGRLTEEAMFRQLFPPGHPYRADIIGSHADIQAAKLTEIRDFFTHYYVPNNASLAIVGNIDITATKALIEKYFGTIPRGADVPAPKVNTPQLSSEKRLTMTEDVSLPMVTMAWITPPAYAPGDAEADIAAHLLGGGSFSRLYDALVRRIPIAQSVTATTQSLALGSVFEIQASPSPGHSLGEVEAAIQRELDVFKANGPTPAELTAAKTAIRYDRLLGLEDPSDRAAALNNYSQSTGDPNYLDKDLGRYADVGAAAVKGFAAEQLGSDRRVVIYTNPGPNMLPPEPPTPPVPPADPQPAPSAQEWRSTVPKLGPVSTAPLPRAQRFQLGNGLPVYLLESHALPLAVGSITSNWGSAADPPGKPGLADFTVSALAQGVPNRDALSVAREVDNLGATLATNTTVDGSMIAVSALSQQIDKAMTVLSDVVRSPTFPPVAVEQARRNRLVDLSGFDASTVADRVTRREVYGQNHPYGHPISGTEQAVRSISRDDLVKFHQQAFSPHNCALILAGDLTPAQARKLAEDTFGSWTAPGTDAPRPGPPTPTPSRVLMVDQPGAEQTTLALAQPSVVANDPSWAKLMVLNQVLGGEGVGRLYLNLRELHGYTYEASSSMTPSRGIGLITLDSNVQTEFTGPSIQEMLGELTGLQNAPVPAKVLDQAKTALIRALPARFITNGDSLNTITDLYLDDLPSDYYEKLPARLSEVEASDLQAVARASLRPHDIKIIAVGDRSRIDPQLKALNLGPIAYRNTDGSPTP